MEPSVTSAQQAAIASVRERYERGEISYDTLREALDQIVAARSSQECDTILRELPASPAAPLAALDPPAPVFTSSQPQSIVAVMAQTKKLRRAWQLQPEARVTAVMGEIKLDLGRATLPPRSRIHVRAVMADVTLYVPSAVAVSVRSRVFMGEAKALGEVASGVVGSSHEEHMPAEGAPTAVIEIDVLSVMSDVKVVLTDGVAPIPLGELVRETLAIVTEGIRRGLQPGVQVPQEDRRVARAEPE